MHTLGVSQINQEGRGHTFKFVVQLNLNSPAEKFALGRLLFVVVPEIIHINNLILCIAARSFQGVHK